MRIITLRDALQRASQNLKMYAAHMGVGEKALATILGLPYATLRVIAAGATVNCEIKGGTGVRHSRRPHQKTTEKLFTNPALPHEVRHGFAVVHYYDQLLANGITYTTTDFPTWSAPQQMAA